LALITFDKVLLIIAVGALIITGTLVAHPPRWLVTSHHILVPRSAG